MATEITCIVDTDGTQNPDYTSLNAAITGESGASPLCVTSADLVTNDEQLTIECRATTSVADEPITYEGFTTDFDEGNFVKITVPDAHWHDGAFDTDKYRIGGTSTTARITCNDGDVIFERLFVEVDDIRGGPESLRISSSASGRIIFRDNVCKGHFRGGYTGYIVYSDAAASSTIEIYNNYFWSVFWANYTIRVYYAKSPVSTNRIYNNTFTGNGKGIRRSGNDVIAVNNILYDTSTAFNGTFHADSDTNAADSSTSLAYVTVDLSAVAEDDLFTSASTGDLSVLENSAVADEGIGPSVDSNVPATDMFGTTRSGATCYIGAFEYAAAATFKPFWALNATRISL